MELELGTDPASFKNLLVFLSSGFGGGTGRQRCEGGGVRVSPLGTLGCPHGRAAPRMAVSASLA